MGYLRPQGVLRCALRTLLVHRALKRTGESVILKPQSKEGLSSFTGSLERSRWMFTNQSISKSPN
jgi:hypothetical protein